MITVRRQGDWLSAKAGDELVMMNAEKGNYLGVGEIGARIWDLTETPISLDDLCARLVSEFEVTPAECRADVVEFLEGLVKHGAVALDAD